ncbi:MAG: dynamin family protein [Xenococcaceae cyanobacterium MO_188.B29]|nr:dynamin family protein [Xenococcaceae cyanobacterium MO_188.B29]
MASEANKKLEQVRDHAVPAYADRLKELGNAVADLAQNHADILDSPNIQDALLKFRQAYEESVARLENPNFTIATIGTTSSGKSTIVNALIGRKIAPIEAGEMSGGVLKIKHSKEFKLSVAETEGAQWETGTWTDLNDGEIYDRIRNGVMFPYHQARQEQELIAPQVTAYVPILPAEDSSLLGLPEGIGIKFIDLPGLKSIQDRDNLKVIQQQIHKAFSLVALDYGQVDDRHRKRLLEELKRVVEYLQGRTDSMIFILNRVDQRGQDDLTIPERIEQLQLEIQETLNLDCLPDIIPFSGRFLYYAQCAWGVKPINEASEISKSERLEALQKMFKDCYGDIINYIGDKEDLEDWFRDIRRKVRKGEYIDDEIMKQILRYVQDWSGGKQLWDCMRKRVRESFSELVIVPALIDVDARYNTLNEAINVASKIKKIDRKEELEKKRQNISEGSEKLIREIESIRDELKKDVETIIEALKTNDTEERSKAEQYLKQKEYKGFIFLLDAVREVEGDLTQKLIIPVRDALEKDKGTYELEEELTKVVTPPKAKAIAKAYDLVHRKLNKFELNNSGYFIRQVRKDDKEEIRSMEHAEKAVRSLYYAMRQAISSRAEFTLQGQTKKFEEGLQNLVYRLTEELKLACQQELPNLDLDKVIITDFESYIHKNPPELPEGLFDFSSDIKQNTTRKKEVVGTKQEQQRYTEGSCFKKEKTRTVTKDVYGDIEYRELKLPDYKNMARQWSDGITRKKQNLWVVLDGWIGDYLDKVTKECDLSIDKAIKFAERAFDKQLQAIEKDEVKQAEYWEQFEKELSSVTEIYQQLKEESV